MVDEPLSAEDLGRDQLPPELSARMSASAQRVARRSLGLMGLLSACSMLGVASWLYLVNHHPLLLVALSPIGRHLMLVAPMVDPVAFVLVAGGRRLLFYVASFHLGSALGPAGLVWLEVRAARLARFVRWLERLFERAPRAVVLLMPGPTISALAGIGGMRFPVFLLLASTGLVVRMLLMIAVASWLREPIEALLELIDAYWVPGSVLMVLGVLIYRWVGGGGVLAWAPGRRR